MSNKQRELVRTISATMISTTTTASSPMQKMSRNILSLWFNYQRSIMERVPWKHKGRLHGLGISELDISSSIHKNINPYQPFRNSLLRCKNFNTSNTSTSWEILHQLLRSHTVIHLLDKNASFVNIVSVSGELNHSIDLLIILTMTFSN